ncbi:hypothetical protein TREMEDRAFT_64607 [Tremella mesenterica DSM 1558]|uniref:uncharacterized protein n=1 Tax=Tremella mesenterica (strain ATCC 24925 / CBS 8224 / DSM 1558 / NBRC 9311 / NRRL Y-6157 / RJB 2259-6 / UBC 559-6) TaxID=578456 RepID=UPI0003F4A59B|nr:uncharacterized protein TREMEDRAFT_64607 [Tremella mesenterica DSM 1558]EIW67356.1 hypothetical protein TREMEDRAFT_64607 [Tremella mesenterica DSM 1558]
MVAASGRGRGRGGGNAGAPRGGPHERRGSWRGGPPSLGGMPRGASPVVPGSGQSPMPTITDHMNDLRRIPGNPSPVPGKGFMTDSDISNANFSSSNSQRELQPWYADDPLAPPNGPRHSGPQGHGHSNGSTGRDAETFGQANVPWDQFETNARLFGTKTSYQEEIYTTKLNRAAPDFRKREKEAERLANEILNQSTINPHLAEERNQEIEDWAKDDEEKYSGVIRPVKDKEAVIMPARSANAYVPPGARKSGAGGLPQIAPRASLSSTPTNGTASAVNGGVNGTSTPDPAPVTPSAPTPAVTSPPPVAPSPALAPPARHAPTGPARRTSDVAAPKPVVASATLAPSAPTVNETKPASTGPEATPGSTVPAVTQLPTVPQALPAKETRPGVVDSFRQFVGTERERAEARKQSINKSERERQLADLKSFQATFQVPLPMPKDILPILAKDEEKQKAIEAQAAKSLANAKAVAEARRTSKDMSKEVKAGLPKKIIMRIPEIPPFNPVNRKPPSVPVTESARKDVPQVTSPAPTDVSQTSAAVAKLNVRASAFIPNPHASTFKPGQSSTSPQVKNVQPSPTASDRPLAKQNPFFRDTPPRRIQHIDPRADFNPWRHGQVPLANTVEPQWPYTGRRAHAPFSGGPMSPGVSGPFDEGGPSGPHMGQQGPPMMQGMPPNFPPYYRYGPNQGMPPGMQMQMNNGQMFSPPPHFQQLPGHPGHPGPPMQQPMGGPPPPNGRLLPALSYVASILELYPPSTQARSSQRAFGTRVDLAVPMYFQNGMPQHPQFIPPQHMQYHPHTPQRNGPMMNGQPPPHGGQMFFPTPPTHNLPQMPVIGSPLQTPHTAIQHQLPFPGQPPNLPGQPFVPLQPQPPPLGQTQSYESTASTH